MSSRQHRNALAAGFRLHWYEIDKVIGQGGFGITYLAHDINLNQFVAITEYLPLELAVRASDNTVQPVSEERGTTFAWGLDRFLREGQTLAQFKHPNIVRVLSLFEANNTGYMVMEHEQGTGLEKLLRQQCTLDEARLLAVVMPLLDGMERVHEAGFIHRDIKPANIVVRTDGTPVLLDFGSARQAFAGYTRTLTTLVSPGYAPFEQYASKGERQGPWTDIYALAATMYRAISGKTPADAIERNVVLQQEPDPLQPVVEIGKGWYSQHLLEAVDAGLAFLERDRPQSVAQWRAMIVGDAGAVNARTLADAPTVATTEAGDRKEKLQAPVPPTQRLPTASTKAGAPRPAQTARPARRGLKWWAMAAMLVLAVGAVSHQWIFRPARQPLLGTSSTQTEPSMQQAQPTEAAGLDRGRSIRELLAEAEDDLQSRRLTRPPGNNALERYREVIALDPDNAQAQRGLSALVDRYLGLAAQAAKSREFDKARRNVAQAAAIAPDSALVERARNELAKKQGEDRRRVKQQLAREAAGQRRVEIERRAQARRQEKIRQLLGQSDEDIKASRLSSPEGDNALERLRQVQALDRGNPAAREGLRRIVIRYLELAKAAASRGQFETAQRYLGEAAAIAPRSPKIRLARSRLAEMRSAGVATNNNDKLQAGLNAFERGDSRRALQLLKPLAAQGEARAQTTLGFLYVMGRGVTQDEAEAATWFRKAAAQGLADAQYNLGTLYESGRGVTRDEAEAARWYGKAAAQGHVYAQAALGNMYASGHGVAKNRAEASKWLSEAAGQGHKGAQERLKKLR
ncbi:MAG: protein kinase [Acidiferrobacterales bacterium]